MTSSATASMQTYFMTTFLLMDHVSKHTLLRLSSICYRHEKNRPPQRPVFLTGTMGDQPPLLVASCAASLALAAASLALAAASWALSAAAWAAFLAATVALLAALAADVLAWSHALVLLLAGIMLEVPMAGVVVL